MSVNMNSTLRRQLLNTEVAFRKACEQVFVLNREVMEATKRFNDADHAGNKITRYSLRLRLSILEGVRNMFYEFAAKKAADIVELQRRVLDIDYSSADDSDSDMSELAYGTTHTSDVSDDSMETEEGLGSS